jgi:hypothetical protein
MFQQKQTALKILENCELSGVTFIRDYLQLHFDGPLLNGYIWPILTIGGNAITIKASGYRDALCAQIGKQIASAVQVNEQIVLRFNDCSEISFSLKAEDQIGPETVVLYGDNNLCCVW